MTKQNKKGRYSKKTSRKSLWITIGVVGVLLMIGLVVLLISESGKMPASDRPLEPVEVVFPQISEPTTDPTEYTTQPTVTAQTEHVEQETVDSITEPTESEPTEKPTQPTKPTTPKEPERETIAFPYAIPGTDLVVQYINSYSGIFMEDGSDRAVEDISAMVIVNQGQTQVEYAKITIYCNEAPLTYDLSGLPAGATIVVQESNATPYSDGKYYDCLCEIAELETFEMSENQVRVEENKDGHLLVTNLTDETIPTIRIFYKFYMFDEDVYVCGITYTAKIQDLEGNASCVVAPSHYVPGSSRIVMVRTYDAEN